MYHSFRTEWPCLTFDLFRDDLGDNRQRFPHSMFMMSGSQADKQDANKLTLLKLSDLGKTPKQETEEDEDDNNSDTDDEVDYEPVLEHVDVPHMGGINRLRCMPTTPGGTIAPGIVATMGDNGKANIFDLRAVLKGLMSGQPYPKSVVPTKAAYTMHAHTTEGYAIDWSPTVLGRLASGDCAADICVWMDGLNHKPATQMFKGHTDSVEDLQWSPSETTVFCSASADNTVKVWDIRGTTGPQISIDAHTDDVNVIAWNPSVNYLLASGCDDGSFKVCDTIPPPHAFSPPP